MRLFLIGAGALLLLNGLFMSVVSNFNLGVILTVLTGGMFFCWGFYYDKIAQHTKRGWKKYFKSAVIVLICMEFILVGFLAFYGQIDNIDYTEDAVIVLGAGLHGDRVSIPLAYRLDSAAEYHKKNPDAIIVVTGGQGFQESITEAEAMENYLLRKGVRSEKIIKEEKATSTNENMRFSKKILDGIFKDDYSVVVITNNFHIYRGVSIAKNEGFNNVYHKHAALKWYNMVPCYLRESLAVLKMWVFD